MVRFMRWMFMKLMFPRGSLNYFCYSGVMTATTTAAMVSLIDEELCRHSEIHPVEVHPFKELKN